MERWDGFSPPWGGAMAGAESVLQEVDSYIEESLCALTQNETHDSRFFSLQILVLNRF